MKGSWLMQEKNKKVISISGDKNSKYEQVIFIMKNKNEEKRVVDFVEEAEKIISGYSNNNKDIIKRELKGASVETVNGVKTLVIRKSRAEDVVLNIIILLSCIALAVLLIYMM